MNITPELLLQGYAQGVFPMAEHRNDPKIYWVDPQRRGIIPLNGFHISRSLARCMRQSTYHIAINTDFAAIIDGCADRPDTWISNEIRAQYISLHKISKAHSLEVWQDSKLIGGVYGVALGAAFFGESMFSTRPNASKIALAYLVDMLREANFKLLDTQFLTPHLASLGAIEIPRADYHNRLRNALSQRADFNALEIPNAQDVIQRNTQTS